LGLKSVAANLIAAMSDCLGILDRFWREGKDCRRPKAAINGLFGDARNGEGMVSLRWAGGIARQLKTN